MSVYELRPCECGNTDIEPTWDDNTTYLYGAIPIFGGILYGYECPVCGRRSQWCHTREEAVAAWNGRTDG
jgi:hypothetical protein